MGKQRMRLFSFRPSKDHREFYVSEYYKLGENGSAEMTGKQHDITDDVLPYLVKAQRDMAYEIRDMIEAVGTSNTGAILEFIDEAIDARTDAA